MQGLLTGDPSVNPSAPIVAGEHGRALRTLMSTTLGDVTEIAEVTRRDRRS
jgi:hypothetical protein